MPKNKDENYKNKQFQVGATNLLLPLLNLLESQASRLNQMFS